MRQLIVGIHPDTGSIAKKKEIRVNLRRAESGGGVLEVLALLPRRGIFRLMPKPCPCRQLLSARTAPPPKKICISLKSNVYSLPKFSRFQLPPSVQWIRERGIYQADISRAAAIHVSELPDQFELTPLRTLHPQRSTRTYVTLFSLSVCRDATL